MKIAVISDIHGNAYAFDLVLADLKRQSPDQIVCLGDAIQGGPQPAEVVARLRDLACPIVMGNADSFLLYDEPDESSETAARMKTLRAVREWSLTKLSDDDRAFSAAFRPTVEIPLEPGRSLLCFHGSPTSFNEVILPLMPQPDFDAVLMPYLPHLMCGGHTHVQQLRRVGVRDSFFFNPGSIGRAYNPLQFPETGRADPWAEYALLTTDQGRFALEFRRIPFDAQTLIGIYRASGRPYADDAIAEYSA